MNIYAILTIAMICTMFISASVGVTAENAKVTKISYIVTVTIPVITAMIGTIIEYGMLGVLMVFIGIVTMIASFILFYRTISGIKRASK